jgi:hypothetical protein
LRTWRQLRKELRQAYIRDTIDWLDWALAIDTNLAELVRELSLGTYQPLPPSRFEAPKSKGAYRVVTVPNVRDALVYRHIADRALELAIPNKVKGAFFSRSRSATPVGRTFNVGEEPSPNAIEIWLRYQEYRSITLLNQPYRVLVVTDITNYFDCIPHDLLLEYLAPLGLPRQAIGVLGKLFEALRPTAGHSASPRIGLAQDDHDCSRQLAHIFLFEHDRRLTTEYGENNYVRWMDDQNIGVDSMPEARRAVNRVTRSLAQQRLTLNSGKTQFLTPADVAAHFHLEANRLLNDVADQLTRSNRQPTPLIIAAFRLAWAAILASPEAGTGNWDKVLKRAYGLAAQLGIPDLEARSLEDLIQYPYLAERIFAYFARRNRGRPLFRLFAAYMARGENLHEVTEAQYFDAVQLLDPSAQVAADVRDLADAFARGAYARQTGRPLARSGAIMCMYWLGSPAARVATLFTAAQARGLPKEVARSWLACGAALRPRALTSMLNALVGHPSDDVARMSRFLLTVFAGTLDTVGWFYRQKSKWPARGRYYDPRAWLVLDLCSRSPNPRMRARIRADVQRFARLASSRPEQRVLSRVRARL